MLMVVNSKQAPSQHQWDVISGVAPGEPERALQMLDLRERFPDASKVIDAWFEAIHKNKAAAESVFSDALRMNTPIKGCTFQVRIK